ncbi:MAG: hypothetical protein ACTS6G_04205 [Candidatus Hodgkinia cicadicola]
MNTSLRPLLTYLGGRRCAADESNLRLLSESIVELSLLAKFISNDGSFISQRS